MHLLFLNAHCFVTLILWMFEDFFEIFSLSNIDSKWFNYATIIHFYKLKFLLLC